MEDKEDSDNKKSKDDSWLVSISFNIISDACPFNGSRMTHTFLFGNELIKDSCFHPMNKNWIMWMIPRCRKDCCPIRAGN